MCGLFKGDVMVNKKAQSRNENAAFAYLVLFCFVIIFLYVLSQFLFVVGLIIMALGVAFLFFGYLQEEESFILFSIILFVVGFLSFMLGLTGINFFENNEVGSGLLETSTKVINITADTYKTVENAKELTENTQRGVLNNLSIDG